MTAVFDPAVEGAADRRRVNFADRCGEVGEESSTVADVDGGGRVDVGGESPGRANLTREE
jgi:hypothetical protein